KFQTFSSRFQRVPSKTSFCVLWFVRQFLLGFRSSFFELHIMDRDQAERFLADLVGGDHLAYEDSDDQERVPTPIFSLVPYPGSDVK
ncbi:hypothetical protein LINPERPRIM_LOCUS32821, partial [Linum perenne]